MNEQQRYIVFDLGGVLARISTSWPEIAARLHLDVPNAPSLDPKPDNYACHIDYQLGTLGEAEYLSELARLMGCTVETAAILHDGILVEPYPGSLEFVQDIIAAGLGTGCLSNTNDRHWGVLTHPDRFPAIALLEHKMASHLELLQKPDHAIFQRYADRLGVSPSEIVYFDDKPENVEAANAVGFVGFVVDPKGDTISEMRTRLDELGLLRS